MLPVLRAWRQNQFIAALVWFHTRDDDKDHDTDVIVRIRDRSGNLVASTTGQFGRFPDHTTKGPFRLHVRRTVFRDDVLGGSVQIAIAPVGNDTWRFTADLKMVFAGGNVIWQSWEALDLDEERRDRTFHIEISE